MSGKYNINQKTSATRRIKKMHKKARFVGFLYLLGTIFVSVVALLGCLKIQFESDGKTLSILNFYRPFFRMFGGDFSGILVFLSFLVMAAIIIVNFFRSFTMIRKVWKKNDKNIHACNRNLTAMEDIGGLFASNFATVLICYTLMYVFTPNPEMIEETGRAVVLTLSRSGNPLTIIGIIVCAFGLLIHFLAGTISATSSLFIVRISVEEKKREDGVGLFFLRSLVKVLAVCAIMAMMLPCSIIHKCIPLLLKFNFEALMPDLIIFALQVLALIFLCICIKKATSTLEFNLFGMDAYGMRKFAVFALFVGILNIGMFVLSIEALQNKTNPKAIGYLISALIAIAAFVLDFVIKPKDGLEKQIEEPKPQQEPAKEQPQNFIKTLSGAPTNSADLAEQKPAEPEKKVDELPTKWQVVCPTCGKTLAVKDAPYHRCPSCGKVFKISVGKIDNAVAEELSFETPIEDGKKKTSKKIKKQKAPKPVKVKKEKRAKMSTKEILASLQE